MAKRLVAVALVVLAGLFGSQAFAHSLRYADPGGDDARGPIDLSAVSVDHDDEHLIVTWHNYGRFRHRQFQNGADLIFQLNRGGDINFVVEIDYRNGEWVAAVCYEQFCDFDTDRVTPATRVDAHRIRVVLERAWLPEVWKKADGIQWQAQSVWSRTIDDRWDALPGRTKPDGGDTFYHHLP